MTEKDGVVIESEHHKTNVKASLPGSPNQNAINNIVSQIKKANPALQVAAPMSDADSKEMATAAAKSKTPKVTNEDGKKAAETAKAEAAKDKKEKAAKKEDEASKKKTEAEDKAKEKELEENKEKAEK